MKLHGNNAAVLSEKIQNDWEFEMDIMDEWNFARILFYSNTSQVYLNNTPSTDFLADMKLYVYICF